MAALSGCASGPAQVPAATTALPSVAPQESCNGATRIFDRAYTAADADTAVRDEAPHMLRESPQGLRYERIASRDPNKAAYNVWRDADLIAVAGLINRPGASGIETLKDCDQTTPARG